MLWLFRGLSLTVRLTSYGPDIPAHSKRYSVIIGETMLDKKKGINILILLDTSLELEG